MAYPGSTPFRPIGSFETTLGSTSALYALESTSAFVFGSTTKTRTWDFPSVRQVQIAESSGVDFHYAIGSSNVVASSSDSVLGLGGAERIISVTPSETHISIAGKSTDVVANITIGHGL